MFHQLFGPPKNVFRPPTLVAAVGDFKEGGVDDAGSQRADRQCTYSSRRGWRQAREWRDKGAPSALLAAIVHNLKISRKYQKHKNHTFLFHRVQDLHISCGELKVVDLSQLAPE